MSADPAPATIPVSVRLPASLLAQLDELCALTERQRSYWITTALEDVIPAELEETRIIDERLEDPRPSLSSAEFDDALIAAGATTREALDRARARHAQS